MNRDEIRALIGGYATGSLTEAEKTALFEAALDDQELFDELAREQALKEVIDRPGVRERLIASLQPARAPAQRKRSWPWAAAAVTAMVIVTIFALRPEHRREVAGLEPPRTEPRAKSAPHAAPAPAPSAVPKRAAPIRKRPAKGVTGPQASARKDTAIALTPPAVAPLPPPAVPRPQQRTVGSLSAVASGFLPRPFGFHYAIDWTGDVTVTADSDGYLRIQANRGDFSVQLFPGADGLVRAGSTASIALPPRTDAVLIGFYASPPPPNEQAPYTGTTNASGAVSDPAPSADSKLLLRVTK